MSAMPRVLIAGCGRLGNLMASELLGQGAAVWGIRRTVSRLSEGIKPVPWAIGRETAPGLPAVDWLVYAASPDERSASAYRTTYVDGPRQVLAALPRPPTGVVFVSSTAVFAQDQGQVVDESAQTHPKHFNGRILLEAEQTLADNVDQLVIARCSGLYGPDPGRIIEKLRQGRLSVNVRPPVYGNRIHRQDAARALAWIISSADPEPLYLLTDTKPTPRHEVYLWLADTLGAQPPELIDSQTNKDSETDEAAVRGKRLLPKRLLAGGFRFRFPDYRSGFQQILSSCSLNSVYQR